MMSRVLCNSHDGSRAHKCNICE
ncbi:hypothetical protein JMJ77_0002049 [Colletotrichum scovillei]|uniref:Uncharacterized protein n=1 Tax=Colletotrichum scovillei TaxID=1209932 RepID=A0A9P7UJ83_9PEZI|nr:hypothetical protein JMJ77_0002049 [Colletotrichum scovillei]KAG7070462.1 hypothetical protein JMJ76_0001715 [Colletotrichum scovillei]KAG7078679.1 hypothetical protein JMJ78_0002348 [Colletotrichum scovillei]